MKASGLIVLTALGVALALPVAAHHMSPMDVDIGDMMGMHDDAIDLLDPAGEANSDMGWDSPDAVSPALDVGGTGAGIDTNPGSGLTRDPQGTAIGSPR
jgi:hypothetical protein